MDETSGFLDLLPDKVQWDILEDIDTTILTREFSHLKERFNHMEFVELHELEVLQPANGEASARSLEPTTNVQRKPSGVNKIGNNCATGSSKSSPTKSSPTKASPKYFTMMATLSPTLSPGWDRGDSASTMSSTSNCSGFAASKVTSTTATARKEALEKERIDKLKSKAAERDMHIASRSVGGVVPKTPGLARSQIRTGQRSPAGASPSASVDVTAANGNDAAVDSNPPLKVSSANDVSRIKQSSLIAKSVSSRAATAAAPATATPRGSGLKTPSARASTTALSTAAKSAASSTASRSAVSQRPASISTTTPSANRAAVGTPSTAATAGAASSTGTIVAAATTTASRPTAKTPATVRKTASVSGIIPAPTPRGGAAGTVAGKASEADLEEKAARLKAHAAKAARDAEAAAAEAARAEEALQKAKARSQGSLVSRSTTTTTSRSSGTGTSSRSGAQPALASSLQPSAAMRNSTKNIPSSPVGAPAANAATQPTWTVCEGETKAGDSEENEGSSGNADPDKISPKRPATNPFLTLLGDGS